MVVLALTSFHVWAQQPPKEIVSFQMAPDKSFSSNNNLFRATPGSSLGGQSFDFLDSKSDGNYSFQLNEDSLFGEEFIVGMRFSDRLSFRLNVVDGDDTSLSLFSVPQVSYSHDGSDLAGYQLGVSSVFNLGQKWKFGIDLGKGQLNGDYLGMGRDNMSHTSLGLGVRFQQFGATVNSDFFSRESNDLLEQSTLDLKVDWHFTKDGTISIGARTSVKENTSNIDSVLDQLNGTVPYIKFKHNL